MARGFFKLSWQCVCAVVRLIYLEHIGHTVLFLKLHDHNYFIFVKILCLSKWKSPSHFRDILFTGEVQHVYRVPRPRPVSDAHPQAVRLHLQWQHHRRPPRRHKWRSWRRLAPKLHAHTRHTHTIPFVNSKRVCRMNQT